MIVCKFTMNQTDFPKYPEFRTFGFFFRDIMREFFGPGYGYRVMLAPPIVRVFVLRHAFISLSPSDPWISLCNSLCGSSCCEIVSGSKLDHFTSVGRQHRLNTRGFPHLVAGNRIRLVTHSWYGASRDWITWITSFVSHLPPIISRQRERLLRAEIGIAQQAMASPR